MTSVTMGVDGDSIITGISGVEADVPSAKETWLEKMGEVLDKPLALPRWKECWELVLRDMEIISWSYSEDLDCYEVTFDSAYRFTCEGEDDVYIPQKICLEMDSEEQVLRFLENSVGSPSGFCGRGTRTITVGIGWLSKDFTVSASAAAQETFYDADEDVFRTSTKVALPANLPFSYSHTRENSYQDTLEVWSRGFKEALPEGLPEEFFPDAIYLD